MMKIPTLFRRGGKDVEYHVLPEITAGCEWVLDSTKGLMTIKIDGQNVKIAKDKDGNLKLYKRLKPANGFYTEASYIPVIAEDPVDQYLVVAYDNLEHKHEGIYEVYGPRINGNPQGAKDHYMIRVVPVAHDLIITSSQHRIKRGPGVNVIDLFNSIKDELEASPEIEGIVFHWEEPSMMLKAAAKIKRRDFGFPWPAKPMQMEISEIPTVG